MQNQNTRPNDGKVLSEVLTCIAHMLHHKQIKPGTRALLNIMDAVEGYDSGDIVSFTGEVLHNFEGQPQPYEAVTAGELEECRINLWEAELGLDIESPIQPGVDSNAPERKYSLDQPHIDFIHDALDAYVNSKHGVLTHDEERYLEYVREQLSY